MKPRRDGEWLIIGLDKLKHMSRVVRKTLLMQLASIEAVHEKLESSFQGFWATGKTTRAASQSRQIMAQLGVISFNRIGVRFALGDFIDAPVVPQAIIGIKGVAVVAPGFGRFIHHLLDHFLGSLPDHFEAQIAAGEAVYDRDDEDLVFLSPMKVNSSSISASLTWLGTGGSGSWSACAWIHRETVR
jgi:hypothetical protein